MLLAKRYTGWIATLLAVMAANATAQRGPVDYVNTLIGTAPLTDQKYLGGNPAPGEELYSGTVSPCAMVPDPHGYLCVGPVTGFDGAYHVRGSGYRFDDTTIMGFTQMNGEYSDQNKLLFMPTVGRIKTTPGTRTDPISGYRAVKDAQREKASAGFYSVFLKTYGVTVDLTATANCGFHRYTFPRSQQANILVDLANSRPAVSKASVRVIDQHTIEGSQTGGTETVFFRAEFSKDAASLGTWDDGVVVSGSSHAEGSRVGAYATFNTFAGEKVLVRVGTSTISLADAAIQLHKELPAGEGFEAVQQQARTLWSQILDRMVVTGGSEGDRTNFYTAVYRMAAGPKYSWFPFYDAAGMLLARGESWVSGRAADTRWHWGGGYWGPGNVSGLVGLYKMGFHIDVETAYQMLRREALSGGGAAGQAYRTYGYVPAGAGVDDYVNRSIGLALDDHALAQMAKMLGKDADEDLFSKRSNNYKLLYNPVSGFFAPRQTDGSWIEPLDPIEPHAEDIYREGNAWNYLWFNTGDLPGLITLLGGPEPFASRLDIFFNHSYTPKLPLRDLTGVVGLYFHGNEQYRHIPYLYDYVGQPWKTQALVRQIEQELYRPVPAGLCGMDDFGDLEGWYVTSALGFLQVDLASDDYQIGSPLFPKVTISLEGDHPGTFTIIAHRVSGLNKYIQSATLNGKPLNVPHFRQSDMVPGGSLVFEMGPTPNLKWGIEEHLARSARN